jgi:uncharacterized protein (TIGR03437 family)
MTKRTVQTLLLAAGILSFGASAQAQSWDNTGNGMLNGPYYVRQVVWQVSQDDEDLNDAVSIYGEITFSPSTGTYVFNGSLVDAGAGEVGTYTNITGTYTIAANGYGFMDSLVNSYAGIAETVFGLVSNGIFIGSSTENLSGAGLNDLLIMAPIASPAATNATFKGSYSFVDLDYPVVEGPGSGDVAYARDALFSGTADGNGNFTGYVGSGYIVNNNGSATRQTGSVKYSFSNGAGNISFGGSLTASNVTSTLITGNRYVYISPDGNFIFGGSPTGWDIFVGVRNDSGAPSNFSGLYYQAGMDVDFTNSSNGFVDYDNYYGSFNATSGSILEHQRLYQVLYNGGAFDFTFTDGYTFNSDGSSDSANTSQHYIYGLNGAVRIGIGNLTEGFLGVNVALAAPTFSGPGVYLNPTGVVNSASFAPFTEQISPGEFLTLAGTGITTTNTINSFFPTKLNGVQVQINGVDAPVYYVLNEGSYDLVSVLVPYETQQGIANIQVITSTGSSNVVSVYVGATQPGSFTQLSNGVGYVAAQRVNNNYSLVTPANPAQPNDSIVVYTTGFGVTDPVIPDGSIASSTSLTNAVNEIDAYFDSATAAVQGTVGFAGLTPGLIGLYQMNITVPAGVTAGDNILELVGLGTDSTGAQYEDTDNFEALIPIGSGLGVNAIPEAKAASGVAHRHPHLRAQTRAKVPAGSIKGLGQRLTGNSLPRPSSRRPPVQN